MIKTFGDRKLERCWQSDKCSSIKPELRRRVKMKLDMMDAATCLDDLTAPPGNQLHPLRADPEGFWSIHVSGPWCLIFKPIENNWYDVQFVQYH
jgi:proteic killer suppression protein